MSPSRIHVTLEIWSTFAVKVAKSPSVLETDEEDGDESDIDGNGFGKSFELSIKTLPLISEN